MLKDVEVHTYVRYVYNNSPKELYNLFTLHWPAQDHSTAIADHTVHVCVVKATVQVYGQKS